MFKSAHGVIAALNERLARRRRTSRRKHRARPRAFAGAIESLEDRRLLAVFTVTSLQDTVEDRDEALTLREAILIANRTPGSDTIDFDPDVFVSDSGPIFLSQQLPVVTDLLTIDGAMDSHRVAIDGLNESRILENASAGLTLRNLILQNGFVLGDGGAILNSRDAVLELNDVRVIDSTAALGISSFSVGALSATGGCGGGLYNATGGTVTITSSTFAGNTAEMNGGGIFNEAGGTLTGNSTQITENSANSGGGLLNSGTATLSGSALSQNMAHTSGGAILNQTGAAVSINAGAIIGNEAGGDGGGLSNFGQATITNTDTSRNIADSGGGISNHGGGMATISGGSIMLNIAESFGGGILNGALGGPAATIFIIGTTINGNTASEGGGLHNSFSGADVTLRSSMISGNTAVSRGGGLSNASGATVEIIESQITGNSAALGGGLQNNGTATISNSSISSNTANVSGGGVHNNGDLRLGVSIAGVRITSNVANGTGSGEGGGGIFNSGRLAIQGAEIRSNNALVDGGGILNDQGDVTITNSILEGNGTSATNQGGGLFNSGQATLTASTVIGNQADFGGGILNDGALLLDRSFISSNFARFDGGGILNLDDLTVTRGLFHGNSAGGDGGALSNFGDATITKTTVRDNSAGSNGGGISNFRDMTIVGSTISGNTAGANGGGIENSRGEVILAAMNLLNSTVSGNTAVNGGGIFVRGSAFLRSVTVASNSASQSGGGVFVDGGGLFEPISTIVADNTASFAPDVAGSVAAVLGFNLIEDTTGTVFLGVPPSTTTITGVDPRLGPLQDNGGPTFTHALLPGSPAINKGSNPTEALFDQRGPGFGRTQGGQTDIGAFEVQSRPVPGLIVVGSGLGSAPEIRIFDPETNELVGRFAPFPIFFRGGIRVATGDVNGDGVADIVASAAPKAPPRVRVFDGTDLTGGTVLMDFFAYHGGFGGGVFVATGDVNNDGRADIITSAGAGGGPRVKVFSGADLTGGTVLMNFLAYARHFRGGVKVAAGDINGDNRDDVITGTGAGGGPRVKVFSGADLTGGTALMNFLAYARYFRGGVQVAAGDVNGDGRDDVITGAGLGGGPRVRAFSGADLSGTTLLADFLAYGRSFRGGVRVATADVNGDGVVDIITGTGALGGSQVRAFDGLSGQRVVRFFASPPGSTRGVFVAGVSRKTIEPPPISAPSWGSGGSGLSSGSFQLVDDLFSDTLLLDQLQSL